jgi:hemoglobin
VVDDFIDRVMNDDRLNKNPAVNEAHHRVSGRFQVPGDRDGVLGRRRPAAVHGPAHGDTHRHLGITQDEWASFMDDLHQSLARFQVPQPEQAELVAIVESTKDAIVVAPLATTASDR